jgi:hypothetical protein
MRLPGVLQLSCFRLLELRSLPEGEAFLALARMGGFCGRNLTAEIASGWLHAIERTTRFRIWPERRRRVSGKENTPLSDFFARRSQR